MQNNIIIVIILLTCGFQPQSVQAVTVNDVAGLQFWGTYTKTIQGNNFDYLDSESGDMVAIFYGNPVYQQVNSASIYLLDPKYYDEKIVLLEIKQVIDINSTSNSWSNSNHNVTYTTYWRQRDQTSWIQPGVSSNITFFNLQSSDQTDVTIKLQIIGQNFGFQANLSYYNDLVQTLLYNLFIGVIVGLQIFCGFKILKSVGENMLRLHKFSLISLSLCSIVDFASALNFVSLIIATSSNYYYFVLPSALYLVLFVLFDMKMMFLVWKSHYYRQIQNPNQLRKTLTYFYILFYLGLFTFLALSYFFNNEQWFIILSNLLLIPQIVRNARIGIKANFQKLYIIGYVCLRIFVPFYERGCPENYFKKRQDTTIIVTLISTYLFSVVILLVQYYFGSRFFIPNAFLPQVYNYQQKIRMTEENKEQQCSICLQNIFLRHEERSQANIEEKLLQETTIMITPCRHKFHEDCLAKWMEVKLQCPTCRTPLPQL